MRRPPRPRQHLPRFTANVTLASQYRYRGIMQTNNKPAIQGRL
ncbi:TorF family putative porin [Cupriavidus basilensis]